LTLTFFIQRSQTLFFLSLFSFFNVSKYFLNVFTSTLCSAPYFTMFPLHYIAKVVHAMNRDTGLFVC